MRKIMSLMLGLSLITGVASVSFAQEKEEKKEKKKGGKKKEEKKERSTTNTH